MSERLPDDFDRLKEAMNRIPPETVVPGANEPGLGNTDMLTELSKEPMRGPRRVERSVDDGDTIDGAPDSKVA